MKEILLIGGTGVLSSAVCAEALKNGMKVTMINRGRRRIPEGVESIVADCTEYKRIEQLLSGRSFDAIIDFLCYHEQELVDSFNLYSQFTSQYFFISSCAVYQHQERKDLYDEDDLKSDPLWSYSVEKWACEEHLKELAAKTKCDYTVIRPAVTYGDTRIPYGIYPPYGYHWTFISRIMAGKPMLTWNSGQGHGVKLRVEDFAVGVVGLIGNPKAYNEAFNICGDEVTTAKDTLNAIADKIKHPVVTLDISPEFYAEEVPHRAGEMLGGRSKSKIFSNAKIKSVVPEFHQTIFLREGVSMTIDAIKAQNYQLGIDYAFDAEWDRICRKWCKKNGLSTRGYSLGFVDYLGTATWKDRYTYYNVAYHDALWMKVVRKVMKIVVKIKKILSR